MDQDKLRLRIRDCGRELFRLIHNDRPPLFSADRWTGKVLDWAMRDEGFKVRLFRFVDVLPSLKSDEALLRHMEEYFGEGDDIPAVLRWGSRGDGLLAGSAARLLAAGLRKNIEAMAGQFIMGGNIREALAAIEDLRRQGFAFCVDILGEAAVSEAEADIYLSRNLELLANLTAAAGSWPALGATALDWGKAPRVNIAVKPTCFYSRIDPMDFDGSVEAVHHRLLPLATAAARQGAFLCIDMEQHRVKDITLAVYRRLKEHPDLRNYPHLGVVLQSYLKESRADLERLLAWARERNTPIAVRLVKGAYWDYETVVAVASGLNSPVFESKAHTDAAFEEMAATILASHEVCHLACASHNIRTIAAVEETALALGVPHHRYEFQMLYGMAEPVRRAVLSKTGRLRLYGPYGALLPGMGYLVRRLLENTSNQSFLRQRFVDGREEETLLADPAATTAQKGEEQGTTAGAVPREGPPPFRNEAAADFTLAAVRDAFPAAIARVRQRAAGHFPLLVGGQAVDTGERLPSSNPAAPAEILGTVALAGPAEIDRAVAAAAAALPGWRSLPETTRAEYLFRTAALLRRDLFELAALEVLEVGKQWHEAHADVAEAIDFCEYYGRELLRLASRGELLLSPPGEENRCRYQGKGIAAVIAPWNFPLAISCGMTAAALVTGNCVLYKPSGLSPLCGARLAAIYREAGLPAGVFNFIPCRGSVAGDHLVSHPNVHLIAFTGSVEVGSRIVRMAAAAAPGQHHLKRVIAEMGGKNAIIVDEDADLDEAVPAVLRSAFGFQGQKCSACSRVIVVEPAWERFVERLTAAARSLPLGPAEEPGHALGPVVSEEARDRILAYLKVAEQEGEILYRSEVPAGGGWYVPLTLVAGISPDHRIAREEIFGPVLALMRAPSFAAALAMANRTSFALTGGVFSRSPANLALAEREFRVGNLYLNRGITGALVGRQPFGGFGMSGIGSKAGGPDYLLQFVDPVTVTENTMRRGFAPEK
ncbi:MAG: proline dehydrogenase family protein [Thermodesulfobacteriota bacterium]